MSESNDIKTIPIIDYALIEQGKKAEFLAQLRHAFIVVGFCYLKNPPIHKDITRRLIDYAPRLFELPQEQKDALTMRNTPHFLGYTSLGTEITRGAVDIREQFDFGTDYTYPFKEGDPDYLKLWGNAQWPTEEALHGFKDTMTTYLAQAGKLGFEFMQLLAESLYLPIDVFDRFYDSPKESMQHRCKVVKYPVLDEAKGNQGVGPHYDSGFLTLLLQASQQAGLQVQSPSGKWIDAKPLPHTLVVNLGRGLETVTSGVARATCHRVLSPDPAYGSRYSIPYFQMIAQKIYLNQLTVLKDDETLHPELRKLVQARGSTGSTDAVNYSEYSREVSGLVALIGRIKSHPDVAERHYPERYREIFGKEPGTT